MPSREGHFSRTYDWGGSLYQSVGDSNERTFALLLVSWTALIADNPDGDIKPNRVYRRFYDELATDPIGLIRRYASYADRVSRTFRRDNQLGVTVTGEFVAEMQRTPIFREYLHFYHSGDEKYLKYVLSFLLFGKKAAYRDESLDALALRKWRDVEARLQSLELPKFLGNLKPILAWIFKEWDADEFLPAHGPGAVSESGIKLFTEKTAKLRLRRVVERAYTNPLFFPEVTFGIHPLSDNGITESLNYSTLVFVPKDIGSSRSICKEPIDYQWLQQAQRLWFEAAIHRGPLVNHVFLRNQGANRRAAIHGSKTQKVDTIDMASASDCVAWAAIRKAYPPKVIKHLWLSRTSFVRLPKTRGLVEVAKFAPMGSALCFPVQCTLFSALVLLAGFSYRFGFNPDDPNVFDGIDIDLLYSQTFRSHLSKGDTDGDYRLDPFYVFGDDVICDTHITPLVIELLTKLGFIVNTEKSYTGDSLFRESCGIYAHDGKDVTPLRFKVAPVTPRVEPKCLAGVLDLANRCYDYGYIHVRRHLIQFAMHSDLATVRERVGAVNPILFSRERESSFFVYSEFPRNDHLRRRSPTTGGKGTHIDLQRCEYESLAVGPTEVSRIPSYFDDYRHVQWWRSHYHSSGKAKGFTFFDEASEVQNSVTLATGFRMRWSASG